MGNGQGVVCTFCKNIFFAKQSNYKTCSKRCRVAHTKLQRNSYYTNNSTNIKIRISKAKKATTISTSCIICTKSFLSKKGVKCCSNECRSALNNLNNKSTYLPSSYINTCSSCKKQFTSRRKRTTCSPICYQTYKSKYIRNRYKTDSQFKIANILRSRLNKAIQFSKTGSAVKDLGCSIEQLKIYLESRFVSGMTWDNYGEWHIDHIKPLASFDLTDYQQLKEACHYTNLQPLWAVDNLRKGNR